MMHDALVDVIKDRERTNSIQKREGLTEHPVQFTSCGCPDPACGGWHTILKDRNIPTTDECEQLIIQNNKTKKQAKRQRP